MRISRLRVCTRRRLCVGSLHIRRRSTERLLPVRMRFRRHSLAVCTLDFIRKTHSALRRHRRRFLRCDRLTAREARSDDNHFHFIRHLFVDARAENHVRGIVDNPLHQVSRKANFVQGKILAANDVQDNRICTFNGRIQQRTAHRATNRIGNTLFPPCNTDTHMRNAAPLQGRADVRKIQIDERRVYDELRNTANPLTEHFVRYFKRVFKGRTLRYDFANLIVRNCDNRVHRFTQFFDAYHRVIHSALCFKRKRQRDDGNRQNFHFLCKFCNHGCGTRTRSAAHTCGDEQKVGILQSVLNFRLIFFRSFLTDGRIRTCPQALGELYADLDAVACLRARQRLVIGVYNDELRTAQARFNQAVYGVIPCAADADYFDFCHARQIVRALRSRERGYGRSIFHAFATVVAVAFIVKVHHDLFPPNSVNLFFFLSESAIAKSANLDESEGSS